MWDLAIFVGLLLMSRLIRSESCLGLLEVRVLGLEGFGM